MLYDHGCLAYNADEGTEVGGAWALTPSVSSPLAFLCARGMEARDAAKVSLRCPCWTIAPGLEDLKEVVRIAGCVDGSSVPALKKCHVL